MESQAILSIVLFLFAVPSASAQTQGPPAAPLPPDALHSLQSTADPREPPILATCKNPPPAPQRPPGPPPGALSAPGPRDYKVTEIPGVIAAGQTWNLVRQQLGNNGDGFIASRDGGLLIAQNDSSAVVKLDQGGHATVVYTGTNTGGALSTNTKGALFIDERGVNPSIVELAPDHRTLADKFQGEPWDCIGAVANAAQVYGRDDRSRLQGSREVIRRAISVDMPTV